MKERETVIIVGVYWTANGSHAFVLAEFQDGTVHLTWAPRGKVLELLERSEPAQN
jgi:hypothetical protein